MEEERARGKKEGEGGREREREREGEREREREREGGRERGNVHRGGRRCIISQRAESDTEVSQMPPPHF